MLFSKGVRRSGLAIGIISDFDQTLINLDLDWSSYKKEFNLQKVADIWEMDKESRIAATDALNLLEIEAVEKSKIHSCCFSIISNKVLGVLTNNSEAAVNLFLKKLERNLNFDLLEIKVVGRETLSGPKENKELFLKGINSILLHSKLKSPTEVLYVGDSEYEIDYAQSLGLQTQRIFPNQTELSVSSD